MKKAICYILGLVFSFFYGFAVVALFLVFALKIDLIWDFSETAAIISGILFTAILITILIKYYKTIKNSFNGSDLIVTVLVTLMVILGVILAVIGGFISFCYAFEYSIGYFDIMKNIIIVGIPVVSIKVGTRLAKSERSKIIVEG